MANMSFKEYLEGRSKFERQKSREKLLEDFEKFKKRQKVMEQKTQASSGKMIDKEKKERKSKKPLGALGGRMKKPKPGSYDYQLQETMKPKYKGMLTGGPARQEALIKAKRKKMGRRGPPKPTTMKQDRPNMYRLTIGQIERRKEMEKRNRRSLPPQTGMLTGGQAKLDKNKNNKIDAQDFKILRAEKAKGRGKGLQDEKMKPGKVTKAVLGVLAIKKAADKVSKKSGLPKGMGLGIGVSAIKAKKMKEILGRNKGGMGKVMKAKKGKSILGEANKPPKIKLTGFGSVLGGKGGPAGRNAETYKKYLEGLKKATAKKSMSTLGRRITKGGLEAAKATRIGKIAAGVAAAALATKAGLEKLYEKRTGKRAPTKRPLKKMGGGMMMRKPMMAKEGKITDLDRTTGNILMRQFMRDKKRISPKGITKAKRQAAKAMGGYMGGGLMEATQKLKAQGKMGGGMMQRPMMAMGGGMMPGYKKGKSVMARGCKLGRKKPTKMYT